jgi:hypothetical protein
VNLVLGIARVEISSHHLLTFGFVALSDVAAGTACAELEAANRAVST